MPELENRLYNQRLGLRMFAVYLLLYVGFMVLCAFAPTVMEWRPLGGLNLALLYGFGLIIAALVLALVYGLMCRNDSPAKSTVQQHDAVSDGGNEA